MCRGDFFLKINKRADQNKAVQGEFFLKINERACTSIQYTRVCWKFKLSISLGTHKSAKTPPAVGKMI